MKSNKNIPHYSVILLIVQFQLLALFSCGQPKKENPALCDPEKGVCETPGAEGEGKSVTVGPNEKPIQITYFTDPICSACWAIEPQLKKLKLEYGHAIHIDYRMGGLLPSWESYSGGGISNPTDVAHHWEEMSGHYGMPIDGDVWLEDPLDSSYPPSIAFVAAKLQDEGKALVFMRRIREMVFLEKKNITQWEHLEAAGTFAGLDTEQLKKDYENTAPALFEADLSMSRAMRVRGFPTLFITSATKQEVIYGVRPYANFESAIAKVAPKTKKKPVSLTGVDCFERFSTLTAKEFAELRGVALPQATTELAELVKAGTVEVFSGKNGNLWKSIAQ